MNRREFVSVLAAAAVVPAAAMATTGTAYTPGLVERELAAGKTVFLDFYTSWCSTCASQERTINALKAEFPAYAEAVTFIAVDWDQHSRSDLAKRLAIPRRSTLVVLKGDQELGRIVAGTRREDIKALMDTALTAATS
ncbi:MAG: thioredoxin family protein [Silicimonas sp.]|nr:thioredoxin family protein [Alphaproteobacteria bacterium]NNE82183.1 thioredoxin family protein [Silicimonas sp.]NNF73503.1 thioredoxin family protein [Paracoccaceae bacterium]NNK67087.1 thioredoxin family protein [Paracoccaceae bacterium]